MNKKIQVLSVTFFAGALLLSYQNCGKGLNVGVQENFTETNSEVSQKAQGSFVFGDQVFIDNPTTDELGQSKAVGFGGFRSIKWPENKIYFDFSTYNISQSIQNELLRACSDWSLNANFNCEIADWSRIQSKRSVLVISTESSGCWSTVGYYAPERSRNDWGRYGATNREHPNQLNLGLDDICTNPGIIRHELGHALGFIHEHQRADRDSYIRIKDPDLLSRNSWLNGNVLHKFSLEDLNSFKKSYDYNSIMHYGNTENYYTGTSGKIFEVIGNESYIIPQPAQFLSNEDKSAVQELYGAKSEKQLEWSRHIFGYIDSVSPTKILGWACAPDFSEPIAYHIYYDDNGQHKFLAGGSANFLSERAVAEACRSTGSYHRFEFELSTVQSELIAGKKIYVYGIHPRPDLNYRNDPIVKSGEILGSLLQRGNASNSGTAGSGSGAAAALAKAKADALARAQREEEAKAIATEKARVAAEARAAAVAKAKAEAQARAQKAEEAKAIATEKARVAAEARAAAVAKAKAEAQARAQKAEEAKAIATEKARVAAEARAAALAKAKAEAQARAQKAEEAKAIATEKARIAAEARAQKAAEAKVKAAAAAKKINK